MSFLLVCLVILIWHINDRFVHFIDDHDITIPIIGNRTFAEIVRAVQLILLILGILYTAYKIVCYVMLKNDKEKLKLRYIKENDERKLLVGQKVGLMGYRITLIGIFFASVLTAYYSFEATVALLIVGVCSVALKIFLYKYYSKKN